jgi:ATP-binding cassette subfamily B protein/subfamily B ATP-binding cassette protein MsbA
MTIAWLHFLRAIRFLRPYRTQAVYSVILLILGALVSLLLPWPLKWIIDSVLGDQPLPRVLQGLVGSPADNPGRALFLLAGLGFLFVLVQNGITVVSSYVNTTIDQGMTLDVRSGLFLHIQSLSMVTHDQRRSGMMIYVVNSLCDAVPRVIMAVPPLAQSFFTLIGMFVVVLLIDSTMALVAMTIVPFLYYSVGFYAKRIQPRLMAVKMMEGESLSIVHEAMSMIKVIVAFCREAFEYRKFRTQAEKAINARIKLTVIQTLFSLGVNTITALGTAIVLGVGAYRVVEGRITAGQLLVVLAYIAAIYQPLQTISATIGALQDSLVNLRMLYGMFDVKPEVIERQGAVSVGRVAGAVTYRDVHFHYTGRQDTLADINLDVKPGQVVAIVGPTGAGKTTLVSMLPRFYDIVSGRILIDGRDIRQFTLKSLREQISVVLQEPLLFSGTIMDNIRYGRLQATTEEVVAAARAANAHEFIVGLPLGYNTELGERGAMLSGGERQRISVARAFLKNAPILILDEPTSSIDSKTEAVILDALDRLMVGRTTFMIAHRLSTIRHADLILVMDHGRIVEQGSHSNLLARGGLYRQLHEMQTRSSRADDEEPAAT